MILMWKISWSLMELIRDTMSNLWGVFPTVPNLKIISMFLIWYINILKKLTLNVADMNLSQIECVVIPLPRVYTNCNVVNYRRVK